MFDEGAKEGNVVRDTVDNDGVARGLVDGDGADFDEFGANALDRAGVDALDQCAGKAVFNAKQDADSFHRAPRGE